MPLDITTNTILIQTKTTLHIMVQGMTTLNIVTLHCGNSQTDPES